MKKKSKERLKLCKEEVDIDYAPLLKALERKFPGLKRFYGRQIRITDIPFYILWGLRLIISDLIAFITTGHHAGSYCIDGGEHKQDGWNVWNS